MSFDQSTIQQQMAEKGYCFFPPIQFSNLIKIPDPSSNRLTAWVMEIYNAMDDAMLESEWFNTENYQRHFEKNKKNIRQIAQGLEGDALILGMGFGRDIPLEDLAKQFNSITVWDVGLESVKHAIHELPPKLRKKFCVKQEDLTGTLAYISQKVEKIADGSRDEQFNKVSEVILEAIEQISKKTAEKKYQLVISSMIASQLFSRMHEYIIRVLRQPSPAEDEQSYESFNEAIGKLVFRISVDHIKDLAEWVAPEGKVYFADTALVTVVDEQRIKLRESDKKEVVVRINEGSISAIPLEEIQEEMSLHFTNVRPRQTWKWTTNVPSPQTKGNVMDVVAYYLKPYPSDDLR